jgi:arylsulfatase A-like enzyme
MHRISTVRHAVTLAMTAALTLAAGSTPALARDDAPAKHVLLISVDGLHQSDLDAYIAGHNDSTFARLAHQGTRYTNAQTPFPSDSFPGLTALVTGANPKSSGVYYDDSWNRRLLAPGTTDCKGVAPGTEVTYFEALDLNQDAIDAGYGVGDLSTKAAIQQNIYKLPNQARDLINSAVLPIDPVTCKPVYPHAYLRVNTVFEVAKQHGLHTAWSDKHAAYDLVNGPSGTGVDDLFAPEINSLVPGAGGDDWTKDNLNTQFYDALKVKAVLNWAHGLNHDGSRNAAGTPAIFGMNFQSVSTAQKLNFSHYAGDGGVKGLGGYSAGGTVLGPVVAGALDFVDLQLGAMLSAIDARDTVVIVSAKHGQSPVDRAQLRLIDDAEVTDALNAGWAAKHPAAPPLVNFGISDDAMLLWLSDRSEEAAAYVKSALWNYVPVKTGGSNASGGFVNYDGTVAHSGLRQIYVGEEAAELIGVPKSDSRVPDVIGIAQVGVVYSSPTRIKKIAEHGGNAAQDRHVPLLVWGAGVRSLQVPTPVETTQVAPTVLEILGLSADELKGVQREHTHSLPGLR